MDYMTESVKLHKELKGKLNVVSKVKLETKEQLSLLYTPGVAQPCLDIAKDENKTYDYTIKSNTIAIISNGTAVLGLGNIGASASIPVMEGKALLFKELGDVNAFPICIKTQDVNELINIIKNISPVFGGINLEDIKAPECFVVENALQDLGIPVMHDDQHGTAIVVLAALINSLKVVNKDENVKVVINGAGSAGIAIANLLFEYGIKNILMCDSKGIVTKQRTDINEYKLAVLNKSKLIAKEGKLEDALKDADVFIGVSVANALKPEYIKNMNSNAIVFGLANPIPEIMPDLAKSAGAKIVATGRSDFPNQINNVLAFPGIFKGALECRAKSITNKMKLATAKAIANMVSKPTEDMILPKPLDRNVANIVAKAIKDAK